MYMYLNTKYSQYYPHIGVHVPQQTLNHEHGDVDVLEHSLQSIERFVVDGTSLKALGQQAGCLLSARGH